MISLNELSTTDRQKLENKILEASHNPLVYINRFCYTFDPRRAPYHLPFDLFPFQENLVLEIKSAIEEGRDLFIEKSRDMGATYTVLDVFLWFWRYIPGSNFIIGSRKEDYVDSTGSSEISNKEESLFGKLEYTLRRQIPLIYPTGFDFKKHLTYMSLINPENGNAIIGESSNPNFSRSGRFKAALLDEFAFWDNDTAAWGSTADSTNCRIVLTTPGIKPNTKAKRLRFGKDGETIKVIELDKSLDPRKTAEWEARERSRRSKEDYAREVERNWEAAVEGRVYDEIKHAVIGEYPYNPNWPLYMTWDFGLDGTAIQWWQHNPDNNKMRIVDSYMNKNHPIQWFLPFTGKDIDSKFEYSTLELEDMDILKNYTGAIHYGDPDVNKRGYQTEEATSTRKILEDNGIYIQTKPESNDFFTRREKTKVMFQKGIEVNSTRRNDTWLECIQMARYPQRSENSQSTTQITLPIHDDTSHHRTATEYLAVNFIIPNYAVITKTRESNLAKINKWRM